MADLLKELFTIEDDFAIDTQKQIHGLQLILEQSNTIVLVAHYHNRIVGMVSMQQLISTSMGERVGFIEDMIVQIDFRGQGIGSLLLTSLITTSKQLGYKRLSLGVDLRNTPAKAFYAKFGFHPSNMGLMYKI
ncbi:MAG: GNAT family N-acetyltransferase [Sulfuricurvum sp.]|nr:GNAT family N-acetyltransferase [Sulfuricurvum sp.]MDP3022009.1 GNAT family N-acetyltransferase [Sulfuricurvum sp.]